MNEEIPLQTKYLIIIIIITVILALFFFTRKHIDYEDELNSLIAKEVNGSIIALKDKGRGTYYLEIKTLSGVFEISSLPIAWEVEKYNIQVGDSLSKKANSKKMFFYKKKNGIYIKYCDYEI